MGGFEVKDPKLLRGVNDAQRAAICTSRRHAIVDFAASSKKNSSFTASRLAQRLSRQL